MAWSRAAPALVLLLIAITHSVTRAETNEQLYRPPWPQDVWGMTTDDLFFEGHGDADNGSPTSVFMWDSVGRFRLNSADPDAPNIGYRYLTTDFGSKSTGLPDQLDELSLAGALHFPQPDGDRVSLLFGAGYSGDNPFADPDGIFGIGSIAYQRPLNDRDTLAFSLDYNGVGPLFPDVPLPGFAWIHRGQDVSWELGYPHDSLHWQLMSDLALDAVYRVPFTTDVTLTYRLSESFSVVGRYANLFNGFRLDDQPKENRMFWDVSRVEIGIRYVNPHMIFEWAYVDATLSVGYAFNQELTTGFDARNRSDFAELSDEPFIGFILRSRF